MATVIAEDRVRTTIYLPRFMHEALRTIAYERRLPMGEIVRRLIEATYPKELGFAESSDKNEITCPFCKERLTLTKKP